MFAEYCESRGFSATHRTDIVAVDAEPRPPQASSATARRARAPCSSPGTTTTRS